jgi:thymidylate kinase
MYIVVEGVDGAGKSELTDKLVKHFDAIKFREPGTGSYGEGLRDLMLNTKGLSDLTLMLGMLSVRSNCLDDVRKYLDLGRVVVSDRGALSTYVYQCSDLENEKLFFETYRILMPTPIIYVVIDIDYKTYVERRPAFSDELEATKCCNDVSFDDLRGRYLHIGRRFGAIHVDGRVDRDELAATVIAKIMERVK